MAANHVAAGAERMAMAAMPTGEGEEAGRQRSLRPQPVRVGRSQPQHRGTLHDGIDCVEEHRKLQKGVEAQEDGGDCDEGGVEADGEVRCARRRVKSGEGGREHPQLRHCSDGA